MKIRVCPRCKKTLEPKDYARSGVTFVSGADPRIKCTKCGYLGLLITLTDDE